MPLEFESRVIHAGIEPESQTGAVMTPIFQTSTFAKDHAAAKQDFEYARTDNPTRTVLQNQLASLESADRAFVFSSGMAAIDAILNLLKNGDHVVAGDDLYGGTRRLFNRIATDRGLTFDFVDFSSRENIAAAMKPNTRLIWFETPTNPLLKIIDIRMVAELGRETGAATVVDNTFMSPYFQRPLELGIDVVMHSMTKYINGHSDVVMGAVMLNDDSAPKLPIAEDMSIVERIKFLQNSIGAVPGPFDCWLVLRGIKTLAVRMQRIEENARKIASWLDGHAKVEGVIYPGLASHPDHRLAGEQASGFGGMISFRVKGGEAEALKFLSGLKLFTVAESLGGVESLAEHPAIMTHASVPAEIRTELGITDNLIRLSVGIESARDLIGDLDQALAAV